jgi:hypothetical protein
MISSFFISHMITKKGFAVEDNRELDGFCPNEVSVSISLPPSDELYEAKWELWTRAPSGLSQSSFEKAVSIYHNQITTKGVTNITTTATDEIVLKSGDNVSSRSPPLHVVSTQAHLRSSSLDSYISPIKNLRICVSANHENNKILFSLCRFLACNEAELLMLSTHPSNQGWALLGFSSSPTYNNILHRTCRDVRQPIGLRNEKEALTILLGLIKGSLSKYPTTLSQDIRDLLDFKSYPVFSNRRHAKIQVMGEKEILHFFQCWCQAALLAVSEIENEIIHESGETGQYVEPNFDQITRAFEGELKINEDQRTIITRYCYDVLGPLRKDELRKVRSSSLNS